MAESPRFISAAELDRMTPDQRAEAFNERVVTDIDELPEAFREKVIATATRLAGELDDRTTR